MTPLRPSPPQGNVDHTSPNRHDGTARGVKIFGVPVRVHFTFILLVIFLIATEAQGGQAALLQVLYILAMFASVLLHELGHAVVSRRFGIATLDIVLYPIGGVSRLARSPKP